MRPLTMLRGLLLAVFAVSAGGALAATEVEFPAASRTVGEDVGTFWLEVVRTGDLSIATTVSVYELWSDTGTTLNDDEVLYNPHVGNDVVDYHSTDPRYSRITFWPGQDAAVVSFSVSNDQIPEDSERLYLELRYASTGTTIGRDRMYVEVTDNDTAPSITPSVGVYSSGGVDEGDETWSFLVLDPAVDHDVTVRVSTYYSLHEANYPVQDDYQGLSDQLVTIPAGETFKLVPVQVYQNDDPNDANAERFQLCIDSVSGAVINKGCETITIWDVPLSTSVIVSSVIFENAIGSGWSDTSWGVSLDTQAAGYSAYGINTFYTYGWAGLSLESDGFDTAGYDTLSFAVKGSASNNGTAVYLAVYRADGGVSSVPLASYSGTLSSTNWSVVHIPLEDLGANDTVVTRIVFESGITGTFFIDELSFLNYDGGCQ